MAISGLMMRFLRSIGVSDLKRFDLDMTNCVKSKYDENYYTLYMVKETGWNYPDADYFFNLLIGLHFKYHIIFTYKSPIKDKILCDLISDWMFNNAHHYADFKVSYTEIPEDKKLTFIFTSKESQDEFLNKYKEDLENFFKSLCYDFTISTICTSETNFVAPDAEIDADVPDSSDDMPPEDEGANVGTNTPNEVQPSQSNKEALFEDAKKKTEEEIEKDLKDNYEKMMDERRQRELFKKGDYQSMKIIMVDSNSGAVDINGRVFEVTSNDTKTGKFLCKVGVDDGTDAIYCTIISNDNALKREDMATIAVGQNIRIEGRANIDKFRKETVIMTHYFFILPPSPLRDDLSKEKRVELHLHTKMSDMDGVTFFSDYVKLAKHMGHKAIAITDHGVVQGFPDAQAIAKKEGIKVLFGSELYVIDDYLHGSINPDDTRLSDATFVCLDTETTGLSTKYDRITEFGAVKVVRGLITDRMDVLIDPEMHIPDEIQQKTNISDEMVKGKPKFREVLPQILKFLEGSIMVTHNIVFDYGMINEEMKKYGFGELKMRGIDTLALSRYLFPDAAAHNLGSLCKRYEVEYNDDKAHRADYDAEVLSNVFLSIRSQLIKENSAITLNDLSNLPFTIPALKHFRGSYHATVLIKNNNGVKDLYKIISDSHINHIGMHPFTTKSYLEEHRKDLLVGSACFNGEVFQDALLSSDDVLRETIKKFDFIEIQPLENYSFLINTHQISNQEHLKEIILSIIKIAEEEGKIIVATGDVHYRDPSDKIYRDIIISAKQIGGNTHPLNPYYRHDYPDFDNPDQHYRSTDEMLECFAWLGKEKAYEYVVTNTNKIADMIDSIVPVKTDTYTPKIENSEKMLTDLVYKNAHRLYGDPIPKEIEDRITSELNGIINNGYSVIYYIAYELVKKANEDGYIVGSRGSVGSSLVATLADITEVNPLPPHYRCPKCKHVEFYKEDPSMSGFDLPDKNCPVCGTKMVGDGQSIPFQTFLGFNADKTPDIDLNFPTDYQSKAHDYTKVLLGASNCFRAGTISTVQFKTAYGYVRNYVETFLHEDPNKFHKSRISSLAYGCTEVKRTTGQHPAGIVVVPSAYDVYDFTPIQYPADDTTAAWKTTHFDFTSMHDTLLKLDILGHQDPQAIRMMCDLTGVNIKEIPVNDKEVLSLFTVDDALHLAHKYMPKDNGALGLPEFGTDFVRQVLRDAQPHTVKDLVIISGLTHGTDVWSNNAQDLIKNGVTDLRGVIGCRDDIMVYLIQKGLDPHNAFTIMETVRKKDKQLKPDQIKDMLDHNVPDYYIESCKKIKYLFPKGHATAYVLMALRVAYFKVHYPLEYYATFFSIRSDQYDIEAMVGGIDKLHDRLEELYKRRGSKNPEEVLSVKEEAQIITLEVCLEMYERGFKMENISLDKSDAHNFIIDKENNALIPPLIVVDGVGGAAAEQFVNARKEKAFTSKEDLTKRGGLSVTNIKQLEELGVLRNLKESDQLSLFDFNF